MPTITFTLSAEHLTRLVDAICETHGYEATINGQPNPETKNAFAKRMYAIQMRDTVREYERLEALKVAQSSLTSIDIT